MSEAQVDSGFLKNVCPRCGKFLSGGELCGCVGGFSIPLVDSVSSLDRQVGGEHYKALGKYQPWEIITACGLDFFEGSVLKYLLRWRRKNGVEDLRKAIHVLERMVEIAEGRDAHAR